MKKNINKPGNATPTPANNAENKTIVSETKKRNLTKEAQARSRARRMRSMLKLGMPKEQIEELFAEENNRMVLVLLDGKYTIQDGTKKKEVVKRGKDHKVISKKTIDLPIILRGYNAAVKYAENEKLNVISGSSNAIWILSDVNNVDSVVEKVKILGRVSITKPEIHTQDIKKENNAKKPSVNTTEAKKNAKINRKKKNKQSTQMRPYYAALRKGGVCARIKRHNPSLADKIEAWLKERKKAEAKHAEKDKEYRAKHRQLTSLEMKANKRARKVAKHLATKERSIEREKKQMDNNTRLATKRAQKARKPVQTKLKMAALL